MVALISTFTSVQKSDVWQATEKAKTNMQAAAAIEQVKVEQKKLIADTDAKNQIAQITSLTVQGYALNESPPQVDWQHSVDVTKETRIFDQYSRCIGYAYQGQFFFIHTTPTACND